MVRTIAQRELRHDNPKAIDAVAAGETLVVTRNGEPVAELRPIRPGRRTFISRDEVAVLRVGGVRIDRHQLDGYRFELRFKFLQTCLSLRT